MELTLNNKTYPLKASLAFLKEIEKTRVLKSGGMDMENGLVSAVLQLKEMADMRSLADLLMALNVNQTPRLSRSELEAWMEETDTDLEELGGEVIDFLSRANVCKAKLKKMQVIKEADIQSKKAFGSSSTK